MSRYLKIEGTEMLRDTSNMSLINKDKSELEGYLNKRKAMMEQKREINNIRNEVLELKSDISQIKELLIQLNNR